MKKIVLVLLLASLVYGGVSSTINRMPLYNCNGSTKIFPFTFPIVATTDIKVILITKSTGLSAILVKDTNYTVSAVNNDYSGGGNITTTVAYSSLYQLLLIRDIPITQETDLISDSGVLRTKALVDSLDKLVMISQDNKEKIGRCLKIEQAEPNLITGFPLESERANKYLAFDANGQPIASSGTISSNIPISSFGETLIDDANALDARTTLGISSFGATLIDDVNSFYARETLDINSENLGLPYNVKDFGAVGDGITDDTAAITNALASNRRVIFTSGKTYLYNGVIDTNNLSNLIIDARGATLVNGDATSASFVFQNGINVQWIGGTHQFSSTPVHQTGAEHVLYFLRCKNVRVEDFDVNQSPEMGLAFNCCIDVTVKNCTIKNTHRDGIHCIYCANVHITGNFIKNVDDDAIAFHDYGTPSAAAIAFLATEGYTHAYGATITGNTTENTYAGITSNNGDTVTISNNIIKNTVACGIYCMSNEAFLTGGVTEANNMTISNNTLTGCGGTLTINGTSFENHGQASSGRAAIIVSKANTSSAIGAGSKTARNGNINNNKILNSYISGIYVYADNTTISGNLIYNGNIDEHALTGVMIENYCTSGNMLIGNSIIDDRTPKKHTAGYYCANGYEVGNYVSGYTNDGRHASSTSPILLGMLAGASKNIINQNGRVAHDYSGGTTAWTLTEYEAGANFLSVSNAGGAVIAQLSSTTFPVGKQYTIYNGSGHVLTFKVSGGTGGTIANGKYAIYIANTTDVEEIYEKP